jgi:hypothetical protein
MQLDAILEVAIGLVFAWLVLSVATMEIQVWIGQVFNWRADFLERSILQMFKNDETLIEQFYNHPVILEISKMDKKGRFKKPDWIPNDIFAEVALEILVKAWINSQEITPDVGFFGLSKNEDNENFSLSPDLQELMGRLFRSSNQVTGTQDVLAMNIADIREHIIEYRDNVKNWFDTVMTQASTWYKETALNWAFAIGLVLALVFNMDTINITDQLWKEPTLRQALVAQADNFELVEGANNITEVPGYFDSLVIPVGWLTVPAEDPNCSQFITSKSEMMFWVGNECRVLMNVPAVNDAAGWAFKLLGILLSALAARQGAPFWFDLLRKLISLRPEQDSSGAQG